MKDNSNSKWGRGMGSHVEQTYCNAFGLKKFRGDIDWLNPNVSLAKRLVETGKMGYCH